MSVTVSDLRVTRGSFTLDIPALTLAPGEVVGLVGHNGAGKSTFLEVLAGQIVPERGQVRVAGHDPFAELEAARRKVGWMTDDMPLFPVTVGEHLRILAAFYPTWDNDIARTLLARFEVPLDRRCMELSKGQGTRLRLVLVLAWRPEVLLLDEPATGLDVPARRAVLREILDVLADGTRTVILSSQQVGDVERVADRLLLLSQGRIVEDGDREALVGQGNLETLLAGEPVRSAR